MRKIIGVVSLEESLAMRERIKANLKANWKYYKMKCVKPIRKWRKRK